MAPWGLKRFSLPEEGLTMEKIREAYNILSSGEMDSKYWWVQLSGTKLPSGVTPEPSSKIRDEIMRALRSNPPS